MLAEPFEPFTSSPSGAAVYQLGPFGTAVKKLETELKQEKHAEKQRSVIISAHSVRLIM